MSGFIPPKTEPHPVDKTRNPLAGIAITVDGPTASGKGTLAKEFARRWRMKFLDTGTLYRAVALSVERQGVDPNNAAACADVARAMVYDFRHKGNNVFGTWLGDEEVTEAIRSPEISRVTPLVAIHPAVREALLDLQIGFANYWKTLVGTVLDGRDTGARICPAAEVKLFLVADPQVRARRRWMELVAAGKDVTVDQIIQDVITRDARDAHNTLRCPDAVVIDASELDIAGVFKAGLAAVEARLGPVPPAPQGV